MMKAQPKDLIIIVFMGRRFLIKPSQSCSEYKGIRNLISLSRFMSKDLTMPFIDVKDVLRTFRLKSDYCWCMNANHAV